MARLGSKGEKEETEQLKSNIFHDSGGGKVNSRADRNVQSRLQFFFVCREQLLGSHIIDAFHPREETFSQKAWGQKWNSVHSALELSERLIAVLHFWDDSGLWGRALLIAARYETAEKNGLAYDIVINWASATWKDPCSGQLAVTVDKVPKHNCVTSQAPCTPLESHRSTSLPASDDLNLESWQLESEKNLNRSHGLEKRLATAHTDKRREGKYV